MLINMRLFFFLISCIISIFILIPLFYLIFHVLVDPNSLKHLLSINILKKVASWPRCIEISSDKLEPHRIPVYLYELSSDFHSYWNMGKDDIEKRFIDNDKTIKNKKLVFLKIVANVIKNGMNILGVETPERM